MALTTKINVNEILNRVAAEVGLAPLNDPFASQNPSFIQMRYLLNTAGEELVQAYPWEFLTKSFQIITTENVIEYDLPDDFMYILNQTEYEHNNSTALGGPLSAQDYAYLRANAGGKDSTYVSFRIVGGKFVIYPESVAAGLDINFEYVTKNWVAQASDPITYSDVVTQGSDNPMFDKTLITRYVKLKYLEATGFDTTKAQDDFTQTFSFLTGFDKAAPILSITNNTSKMRYGFNVPSTNYGGV